MDVYDFEEEIRLETKAREDYLLKKWTTRLTNEGMKAENFKKQLQCQMAIMRVKFPFLDESQLRGKALKNLNVPSICGQIPNLGQIVQLSSSKSKENLMQMVSYIYPKTFQPKNKMRSEKKYNGKDSLMAHNAKCYPWNIFEKNHITSRTRDMSMSTASSPKNSQITLTTKRIQKNNFKTKAKIPQIYQDLEDPSEREESQYTPDKIKECEKYQNLPLKEINFTRFNARDSKTTTLKHDPRKCHENKENIQISRNICEEIDKYNQLNLKKIHETKDLGKHNSVNKRSEFIPPQTNSSKPNIKATQKFPGNFPQTHNESETCNKPQCVPFTVAKMSQGKNSNMPNKTEKRRVKSKSPMVKTKQSARKQTPRKKRAFEKHMQIIDNKSERPLRKSTSIHRETQSLPHNKVFVRNKQRMNKNSTTFLKKVNNQDPLRNSKSKLPSDLKENLFKVSKEINKKDKCMKKPLFASPDEGGLGDIENSKSYSKKKRESENVNLAEYTTYSYKSMSMDSAYEELDQLSTNTKKLSESRKQSGKHQFSRNRKTEIDPKQININHNNLQENQQNHKNSQKNFITDKLEKLQISRNTKLHTVKMKNSELIRCKKRLFEPNNTTEPTDKESKEAKEISGSVYSISGEEGRNVQIDTEYTEKKKKIVKKRQLFCNSTCKNKRNQDVMRSSADYSTSGEEETNIQIDTENTEKKKKIVKKRKLFCNSTCKNKRNQDVLRSSADYNTSGEEERNVPQIDTENIEKKKKIVKKRKLFCNSTCKNRRYQDVMNSSDFENSDYNGKSDVSISNISYKTETKQKGKLSETTPKQECKNLRNLKENTERGKLSTSSICEVATDLSNMDLEEWGSNEGSKLPKNSLDENEHAHANINRKLPLTTPEKTNHESRQLPLYSPLNYNLLNSFSSSEETNEATQEAIKILTDDLLSSGVVSPEKKCHSTTFNDVSLNQKDLNVTSDSCRPSLEIFSDKNSDSLPTCSTHLSNLNLKDTDVSEGVKSSSKEDFLADLFDPLPPTDPFHYIRPEVDNNETETAESAATLLDF